MISIDSQNISKENKRWTTSYTFPFGSEGIQRLPKNNIENLDISTTEAELRVSQIQDPLWRRVSTDILKILGPIAFKDLWKIKFIRVSPEGKKAYLACPDQASVETIEHYSFVIIGALKKFYPFLTSLETEIIINEDQSTRPQEDTGPILRAHFYR